MVTGDRFTVIGSRPVYLGDASGGSWFNLAEAEGSAALSIFDLKLHMLASGDVFDLSSRRHDIMQHAAS